MFSVSGFGVNKGLGSLTQKKESAETSGSIASKSPAETSGSIASVNKKQMEPLFNFGAHAPAETSGAVASNIGNTFSMVA